MTTVHMTRSRPHVVRLAWGLAATLGLGLATGCARTDFPYEGPGQPADEASGAVPPGSIGACKLPQTKRPPLVSPALWADLRKCTEKTPRRFIRVGYSKTTGGGDPAAEQRVAGIMEVLRQAAKEKDGNARMLLLMRAVQQYAIKDESLAARVERANNRTTACDYTYLLGTTEKAYAKLVRGERCAAWAYDQKLRSEQCLFDLSVEPAAWLTSAWGCLAFTETAGEGESCYRLCAYDDYCAAQVSCAAADLDLVLCAVGICLPEKAAAFY